VSLCQPYSDFSCGACCGLFNLDLKPYEYRNLLLERTTFFKQKVDYKVSWTIVEFRKEREFKESTLPKKDEQIYNCPFLGFIDEVHSKIGCMIHPVFTGDPLSQNFSFYGASICQGYNCKNKESSNSLLWEKFLSKLDLDFFSYSILAGDPIFFSYLSDYIQELGFTLEEFVKQHPNVLVEIIKQRLERGNKNITSFEIDMDGNIFTSAKEKLEEKFQIEL